MKTITMTPEQKIFQAGWNAGMSCYSDPLAPQDMAEAFADFMREKALAAEIDWSQTDIAIARQKDLPLGYVIDLRSTFAGEAAEQP